MGKKINEKLIDGIEKIEKNLEIKQIGAEIKRLEDKRVQLYMEVQEKGNREDVLKGVIELKKEKEDLELTKEILRQQLQLLAERSKTCAHENMFSLTTAMLDIVIYLQSN